MTEPDPSRDEDALDHVLGVASAAERAAMARAVAADPALAARVAGWTERLSVLAAFVPPVEPRTEILPAILARLEPAAASAEVISFRSRDELAGLRRSRAVWRGATVAATGIAAALALALGLDVAGKPPSRTFVAAINRSGDLPALMVRVDAASGIVQVRTVAAEVPADRSLELWSLNGNAPPRSLGILAAGPVTKLRLEGGTARLADGVGVAASLEPKGGSPTGAPTGPVVYSGKLIAETP